MGGGSYEREVYAAPTPPRAGARHSTASGGFSAAAAEALATRSLHKDLDPRERSLVCEAENPVVLAIDVTGSMGNWTKIIYDKLPMFYGQLKMQGYLRDPAISFAAVGDAHSDKAPLQVGDFAQGLAIEDVVKKLWLEGKGGSGFRESYEIAACYYASAKVRLAGAVGKPFFFLTGDEACYDRLDSPDQTRWLGDSAAQWADAAAAFEALQRKFHVFLLKKPYQREEAETEIMEQWTRLIGRDRILMLSDPKACVDMMLGAIAVTTGQRTVDEYIADLVERGQDEARRQQVREVLLQVGRLAGHPVVPGKPPREAAPLLLGGRRFRRCAAAAVFNERGEVLLGERVGKPGEWQLPQGGLEAAEDVAAAAARELHEEMGLCAGAPGGPRLVGALPEADECCYEAGSWLRGAGYDGQVLLFGLFFLPGAADPAAACDLSGLGGEKPEFSAARWAPLEEAAEIVWGPKRPAYAYLKRRGGEQMSSFLASWRAGQAAL